MSENINQLPEDEVKNDPSTVIFTDATLPG